MAFIIFLVLSIFTINTDAQFVEDFKNKVGAQNRDDDVVYLATDSMEKQLAQKPHFVMFIDSGASW